MFGLLSVHQQHCGNQWESIQSRQLDKCHSKHIEPSEQEPPLAATPSAQSSTPKYCQFHVQVVLELRREPSIFHLRQN